MPAEMGWKMSSRLSLIQSCYLHPCDEPETRDGRVPTFGVNNFEYSS